MGFSLTFLFPFNLRTMEVANITAPTHQGLTNALAIQLLKYNLTESLAGVSRDSVSMEGY